MSKKIFNLLITVILILIALIGCQMGPVGENNKVNTLEVENDEQEDLSKVSTSFISIPSKVEKDQYISFSWYVSGTNIDNPYYSKTYYSNIYINDNNTGWKYVRTIYNPGTKTFSHKMTAYGVYQFKVDVMIKEVLKSANQTYYTHVVQYTTNNTTVIQPSTVSLNIEIPPIVNYNENLNFSWYTGEYVNNSNYFKDHYSKIYIRSKTSPVHPEEIETSDWSLLTTINGSGNKSYSKIMDQLGEYQFRVDVWVKEGLINTGQTYNYISKIYTTNWTSVRAHVDVRIIYDQYAENLLKENYHTAESLLTFVEAALNSENSGFCNWNIEFHTGNNSEWFDKTSKDFDVEYEYNDKIYRDYYSLNDICYKWLMVSNYYTDLSLPANEGHGSEFDIVILFTNIENFPDILGIGSGHAAIINLGAFDEFNASWSYDYNTGFFSTILHEVGHCYKIDSRGNDYWEEDKTGDTRGKRKSVMDYNYGHDDYSRVFDDGHLRTINSNILIHSN